MARGNLADPFRPTQRFAETREDKYIVVYFGTIIIGRHVSILRTGPPNLRGSLDDVRTWY
jgi:hypothetical protein